MHFAAKNLLYTFNQSLDTQFVTVASFKRYARSPETRTFKNYFRRPKMIFSAYMRKRPQYALSRYMTYHRRKGNLILHGFSSRIQDLVNSNRQQRSAIADFTHVPLRHSIMEKLQHLRINLSHLRPHASSLFLQNKPILQTDQNGASRFSITDYRSLISDNCNKNKPIQSHFQTNHPRDRRALTPRLYSRLVWKGKTSIQLQGLSDPCRPA